jgi:hypothetical protein
MTLKNTVIAGTLALASVAAFAQQKPATPTTPVTLLPAHIPGQLIPKDETTVMVPLLFQVNKLTIMSDQYQKDLDAKTQELNKEYAPKYQPVLDSVNSQIAAIKAANDWGDDVIFDFKQQIFVTAPKAKTLATTTPAAK